MERDPELGAVRLELLDLRRRHGVEHRQAAVVGRDRVVRGRDRLARPADAQAALAEPRERLRAGHLVDEVEVDREDGRGARILRDDVVVPDLLDDGARCGHGRDRVAANERRGSAIALRVTPVVLPRPVPSALPIRPPTRVQQHHDSVPARRFQSRWPTPPHLPRSNRTAPPLPPDCVERVRSDCSSAVRSRSPATRVWLFTILLAAAALAGYLLDVRHLEPIASPVHIPWPMLALAYLAGGDEGHPRPLPPRDAFVLAERGPGRHRAVLRDARTSTCWRSSPDRAWRCS